MSGSDLSYEALSRDDLTITGLCDEFVERRDRGEQISLEAFAAQYPDIEQTLQEALRGLEFLTGLGAATPELDLPSKIAGCSIERVIASGGMGIVLEATHPTVSRRLAIKLLSRYSEKQFQSRFRREADRGNSR